MPRLEADWVHAPATRAVLAAICQGYFVGGCVRNALIGAEVSDIDIATPVLPETVIARLQAAGLKAVPTGLTHGTVTAVHEGRPIEITTFRADTATDGRHAEVAFTEDIGVDAGRRDFTMNALYADPSGEVLDPIGGLPDLAARRVRFIGSPETRIREDYLRILRFFRFHAWYGRDGVDADGLAACAALADGLDGLARERVGWEIRKLLAAPDPAPAVASMAAAGILGRCLPGAAPAPLAPLVHLEREFAVPPDWQARLVAIEPAGAISNHEDGADEVEALRLSRAETRQLARIRAALADSDPARAAYRHGIEAARAAVLIGAASLGVSPPEEWAAAIAAGGQARFPLSAGDLIDAGWAPGKTLGAALQRAEEAWIASGFKLDGGALIAAAGEPPGR